MLRAGGRRPHVISNKASNTCMESHRARPSNPAPKTFRVDSEMASQESGMSGASELPIITGMAKF
jgi:hypothetical protein